MKSKAVNFYDSGPPPVRFGIGKKIVLLVCAIAMLASGAVGVTTYVQFNRALVEQELSALSDLAQVKGVRLAAEMDTLRADAVFISQTPVVERAVNATQAGGVDPTSGESERELLQRMPILFESLLRAKPYYCQVRLIGIADGGQELVRVNREPNGDLRIVPKNELQTKGQEPYFAPSLQLAAGTAYLSEITLIREHGHVVTPWTPVVRAAAPVFGSDGKVAGFVIINCQFEPITQELKQGLGAGNTLLVTNNRGDYLVNSDATRTFGFDRGEVYRIQDDFPAIESALDSTTRQAYSVQFDPVTGKRLAMGLFRVPIAPGQPDRFATMIVTASYKDAIAKSIQSRNRSLAIGAIVVVVALVSGYLLSRSVTEPLRRITAAAEAFGRDETKVDLPIDSRDETGIVARALKEMMHSVEVSHDDLKQCAVELEASRRAAWNLLQDATAAQQKLMISEQAMRDQAARTQAILEGATDAIITISSVGVIESFNAAAEQMFGYSAIEAIGKNVKMLMPSPYRDEHDQYIRDYLATGISRIIGVRREALGLRVDHTVFPIDLAVSEIAVGDKRLYTGVIRDISELKYASQKLTEANEELARRSRLNEQFNANLSRSNEELKQFAYVASHDLQEPLRKVTAFCQLLHEEYGGQLDDNAKTYINYAVDGALRMKTLIQDLLTYSRVETQGRPLEPTDAGEACAEAIDNLELAITESLAEVTCDPLPMVTADAAQLARLFQNLIGNAIKYRGDRPPQIHISAVESNDAWEFRIRDNGIGIDPQYRERVFVIFQRLHARDEYSGTGIGLAVCKRIVERAGGRIWVASSEGAGSEFCFTMPIFCREPCAKREGIADDRTNQQIETAAI